MRIEYDGVNSREAIDAIERGLNQLESVHVEEIGLDMVTVSFDQREAQLEDFERVIGRAGGTVRASNLET